MKHHIGQLRDLDTKKYRAEVFGELQNVVLEENGDKMVRDITNEKVLQHMREDTSKQYPA